MKLPNPKASLLSIFMILSTSLVTLTSFAHEKILQQPNNQIIEQQNWGKVFAKYHAQGTLVIADHRDGKNNTFVFNPERANKRYSPASTFKIPHSLFALDAGLVRDEFEVFKWDGVKRSYELHNQDQNLRSAVRNSAIWVYDIFATQLGEQKSRYYLQKLDYGNASPVTEKGSYWIEGELEISAIEQVAFLKKLHKNELPFSDKDQLLIKDIMVNEADNHWILRAKTGWQGAYGWWVGWVERTDGPVYFALNIDTPNRAKDLYKRKAIVKDILQTLKVLPKSKT